MNSRNAMYTITMTDHRDGESKTFSADSQVEATRLGDEWFREKRNIIAATKALLDILTKSGDRAMIEETDESGASKVAFDRLEAALIQYHSSR